MKVVYDMEAFTALRMECSPLVRALAATAAARSNVTSPRGAKYVASHGRTTERPRSVVLTANGKAVRDNSKTNRIVREVGGLR